MARNVRHPIDNDPRLPDEFLLMIANLTSMSFSQLLDHWAGFCQKLVAMMLERDEFGCDCEGVAPEILPILKMKKFGIWKALLEQARY